jgi:hypothetical protein
MYGDPLRRLLIPHCGLHKRPKRLPIPPLNPHDNLLFLPLQYIPHFLIILLDLLIALLEPIRNLRVFYCLSGEADLFGYLLAFLLGSVGRGLAELMLFEFYMVKAALEVFEFAAVDC